MSLSERLFKHPKSFKGLTLFFNWVTNEKRNTHTHTHAHAHAHAHTKSICRSSPLPSTLRNSLPISGLLPAAYHSALSPILSPYLPHLSLFRRVRECTLLFFSSSMCHFSLLDLHYYMPHITKLSHMNAHAHTRTHARTHTHFCVIFFQCWTFLTFFFISFFSLKCCKCCNFIHWEAG